jgi:hypothetical protein
MTNKNNFISILVIFYTLSVISCEEKIATTATTISGNLKKIYTFINHEIFMCF